MQPRSSELNPVENVWQFLRQTYLSNRVFDTYDDILDACEAAWNRLVNEIGRIRRIGVRDWAQIGKLRALLEALDDRLRTLAMIEARSGESPGCRHCGCERFAPLGAGGSVGAFICRAMISAFCRSSSSMRAFMEG
ncbi:MAG: hypothetical protein KDH19_19820 [Geminicoccaceae bacterium]|nr:hypothetical protein [Geminicoccaceae bacterium]